MPPEEESGATPESRVAGPHRVAGGLSTSWRVWTSICGQWKAVEGFVRQEETGRYAVLVDNHLPVVHGKGCEG